MKKGSSTPEDAWDLYHTLRVTTEWETMAKDSSTPEDVWGLRRTLRGTTQ
jgi:hypothetical protein